ncbi:hypothetical protein GRS48_01940 [Halorubrum sp. JWXQ-INN 858]|uniref:hypothetical protein n=1 Tax=Halorubrum sp. JWXQ-INN 858 TaxID=2690782 RepID=UPI00135905E1|nr:hypothetical protein [Halorubrum sp. JWXQ-INN 858]MWV63588.1 hypothetical protein [Halorubrum sp. JWXQ-INN 858]
MRPRDLLYGLSRPPVLAGAAAQAAVLGAYVARADAPSGTVLVAGLCGGAVAGSLVDRPSDGWVEGAFASALGYLAFAVGFLGYGVYLAFTLGTGLVLRQTVLFVTALSVWALPAYAVLGAVAASAVGHVIAAARRRVSR